MQIIPLKAVPSQTLTVVLNNQICQINLRTTAFGLFCDLYVNNTIIVAGVICQNLNPIVRNLYLGFLGDIVFYDNQGSSDPTYTGLGTRYSLVYLLPTEITES